MDLSGLFGKLDKAAPMPHYETREFDSRVVAHIDGDYMAYFCAGGPECSPGDARRNCLSRIERVQHVSGAGKVQVHLTHDASNKGNRRLAAVTLPYQGQRGGSPKPNNYAFLRDWLSSYEGNAFTTNIWKDREADDGIALATYSAAEQGVRHAIHTRDKDMRMFCGLHIDWQTYNTTEVKKDEFEVIGVDGKVFGHKWFWMQMIEGDTADNIQGIRKAGPAAAASVLDGCKSNDDAYMQVSQFYEGRVGEDWRSLFVENAVLLWMRNDAHARFDNFLQVIPAWIRDDLKAEVAEMERRIKEGVAHLQALQC